jgi:hypothetical protein
MQIKNRSLEIPVRKLACAASRAGQPGRLDPTASLVERVATDQNGWVLVSQLCAQTPLCGSTHQGGKVMDQQKD